MSKSITKVKQGWRVGGVEEWRGQLAEEVEG